MEEWPGRNQTGLHSDVSSKCTVMNISFFFFFNIISVKNISQTPAKENLHIN